MLGFSETDLPVFAPMTRLAAELCIAVGAEETLIPAWIATGRERSATNTAARSAAGP